MQGGVRGILAQNARRVCAACGSCRGHQRAKKTCMHTCCQHLQPRLLQSLHTAGSVWQWHEPQVCREVPYVYMLSALQT